MNWNKLKFLLFDATVIATKYWYLFLAAAVFVFVLWQIDSCRTKRTEKKIERIESNIKEQEIISNILTNQKANIKSEVNSYAENSNLAISNLNNSLRTDSNKFQGTDAAKRFCERFPLDSTCIR